MIVATVFDNDRRQKGELLVKLFRGNLNPRLTYKMLESSAYFEPYKHVLLRIKDPEFKDIPFKQYLVRQNDTEVLQHQPNYARYLPNQEAVYDLTALMKPGYEEMGKGINILNDKWKNEEYIALNGSQLKAVKSALFHELSVIQGPPGTGKTYIALKVVQCLLDNSKLWFGDRTTGSPILVICYKNHALDQFLEGILPMAPGKVVRIGGRSKSKILEPVNLSIFRSTWSKNKKFTRVTSNIRTRYTRDYYGLNDSISEISKNMKHYDNDVLRNWMKNIF